MTKIERKLTCVIVCVVWIFCQGCTRCNESTTLKVVSTLNVTNYSYQTDVVAVRFAGNPQQWHLESITCYDSNGQYMFHDQYILDENNELWKQLDDGTLYPVDRYDSKEVWKEDEIGTTVPEYDKNGMLVSQTTHRPSNTRDDDSFYMDEIGKTYSYSMISNEYRLTAYVSWNSYRNEDENKLSLMEIIALDSVGSGTCFQIWEPFYVQFNTDGTPQFIAQHHNSSYSVVELDQYGRPVWIAWYDSEGNLCEYYVYSYKTM